MDPRRRSLLGAVAAAALEPAAAFSQGSQSSPSRIMTRRIPASGEELPAIGVGTWQTFDVRGGSERAPLREVLRTFSEAGGRVVDSSPMYGAAESTVGDLVSELALRDKLFMATKVWT